MSRHAAAGCGRPRRRQDQRGQEQGPEQEQQQVLQLEPPLVFPGRRDEIADSRKDDGGWLTTGEQV